MTKTGLLVSGEGGAVSLTWNRLLFLFCFQLIFVLPYTSLMVCLGCTLACYRLLAHLHPLSTLQRDDGLVEGGYTQWL